MLKTKDGMELTERELKNWDNVPADVEIKALALSIQRSEKQQPYIVEVQGYEEICCGRIGQAAVGGAAKMIGFVIFAVANNHVTEFSIRTDGVQLKSYHRDKLTLRPSCLRRMVVDGV